MDFLDAVTYSIGDYVMASDPWWEIDSPGVPAWRLDPLIAEIGENDLVWIACGEKGFVIAVSGRLHRVLFDSGLYWVDHLFLASVKDSKQEHVESIE